MQTFFKYLFTFTLLTTISACNNDALEEAMVDFDKAFIPVFYHTYNQDIDSAKRAMLVLDRKWETLDLQFEKKANDAHNWKASFRMVTIWLDEATCAINSQDADLALIQLDLEAAIDIVVQVSNDSMLDLLEWQEFIPMVYDVETTWTDVLNSSWKKEHFDFDASEELEEATRKTALGFAIKDFTKAVKDADRCMVKDAAKEMEAAYLEYIFFFGDFDLTKTFFAAN